jgi:hypothetical protein
VPLLIEKMAPIQRQIASGYGIKSPRCRYAPAGNEGHIWCLAKLDGKPFRFTVNQNLGKPIVLGCGRPHKTPTPFRVGFALVSGSHVADDRKGGERVGYLSDVPQAHAYR